ncbi:MAG: hypothetical protein HWN81_02385 [Candidatus Lokiarchaeota archaeon]|nr:hypothetical protein [Candidatus Lokiarchaeota archaeon]
MATYKTLQESALSPNISHLHCDICGSSDIIENPEGYVCRDCGIVLEIQKLQYDRPYNEDLIQYARGVGKTQIGTRRERITSPLSIKLQRINKYNSITTSERAVIEKARIEIARIFNYLDLNGYDAIKEMVLDKFKKIRAKIRPGSKYRNIEKLVSITIYFCLKLRNVSINPYELIEISNISKKDFNDFILQLQRFLPEYGERNRQEYILQRIFEISEHFKLGMPFYFLSKKILYRLWQGIKNTTDNVVAGLVSSISVLCTCKEKVSISSICSRLGIRMSTIQAQVKKKIFQKFKVDGFISLIKSSDLLVDILNKLNFLEEQDLKAQEEVVNSEREEIILGNASKVFNAHNDLGYYYFAIREEQDSPAFIFLKIYDSPLDFNYEKHRKRKDDPLLEFELYKYHTSKGPPLLEV